VTLQGTDTARRPVSETAKERQLGPLAGGRQYGHARKGKGLLGVCTCSSLAATGKRMTRVLGHSVIVLLLRLGLQMLAGADVRGASEVRQRHMSEQDICFQKERAQATSKGEKEKGQQRCATHPLGHSTEQVAVKVRPRNMVRGSAAFSSAQHHDGLISLSTPS
jgi:hypothetical protein